MGPTRTVRTDHPADDEPSPTLDVVPWADPSIDGSGFDPRSAYAERFWLGLLGPSTLWMLRRFARGLEAHPGGFRISLSETGRALGLGESISRNSTTQRTIARACQFGMALRIDTTRLAVRTELPPLSARQLSRLPDSLRAAHEDWTGGRGDDEELRRAVAAADGLARAGDSFPLIERQLRSWGYPARLAHDAARAATAGRWDVTRR